MDPKLMWSLTKADLERRREEEFIAMHRRPDALPLPPEEPKPSYRARWTALITGWRRRVPAPARPTVRRSDDEVTAV